jgi:predicted dehydrogenase
MPRFPLCVLGAGPAGRGFILNLKRDWRTEVVGFTNRSPDRRQAVATETGIPGFANLAELLAGVRTRPRLAVIATANPTHRALTEECLAAGLDVFCEKPMAMTMDDCMAMVAAERASGRHLQVGFEYRYGSMTARLTELLRQGAIGELVGADAVDSRGHWWPEHPDTPPADVWRLNRAIGGGPVLHCGIHQLDLLRCYAGEVRRLQAFSRRQALSFYPAEVPDQVVVQLQFASGATGSLALWHNKAPTWYRPSPPWTPLYHRVPGHHMDITLTGRGGALVCELYREELHILRYDSAARETVLERTETFHHHHPSRTHHDSSGMVAAFAQRLAVGQGVFHSAADSLETMRLAFAVDRAVQQALASGWASDVIAP